MKIGKLYFVTSSIMNMIYGANPQLCWGSIDVSLISSQTKSATLKELTPSLIIASKFFANRVMSDVFPSLGVRVFLNNLLRTE